MSDAEPVRFHDFPDDFEGPRFRPGEEGYDEARLIFNMRHRSWQPALIARAADEEDVVRLMRYASARKIPVAIRSGGHAVDGFSMPDGALVLDMTALRELSVDPATRTVRAGSGILLGDLDQATQQHGLVVPSGTVSSTGIAGLTLGGGVGYLMRRFGATVDNLLACELVTVDGTRMRASDSENPELFWALRGAGHNIAAVTAFEYRAQAVGPMVGAGGVMFDLDQARDVLVKLIPFMAGAPLELSMIATLAPCPPLPMVDAQWHGRPILNLHLVFTGDLDRLDGLVAGLAALGTPFATVVGVMPWTEANKMLDAHVPFGSNAHTRGGYMSDLTPQIIDIVIAQARAAPPPTSPQPNTLQNIWFMGGAITNGADEDSMAFSRHGANIFWEGVSLWDGPELEAAHVDWLNSTGDALTPLMRTNGYVNLTTDRGPEWLAGLYGSAEKYRRIVAAKTRWDPDNLLRHNKNVKPEPQPTTR